MTAVPSASYRACLQTSVHSHATIESITFMFAGCWRASICGLVPFAPCTSGSCLHHKLRLRREVLEYVANTLIFVLSGVIISNRVHTSSQGEGAIVHALDYAYALLLWVYLLARPLCRAFPLVAACR